MKAAEMDTVQKLLLECKQSEPSTDKVFCIGFIGGISDMMTINGQLLNQNGEKSLEFAMCEGNQPTAYGAKVQAFMNWADSRPQRWGEHQALGVVEALRLAWPCKRISN
jgi:hypothetical protein